MKFIKILTLLFCLVATNHTHPAATKTVPPQPTLTNPEPKITAKQISVHPTAASSHPVAPPAAPKALTPVNVPYLQELQKAQLSPAILTGWQQLYQQFLQAHEPTAKSTHTPNPLFSTNFFNLMASYLNPATFPKFTNDPDSQIHFNYATTHLRDTVARLGSISWITVQNGNPTVSFTGDCRDMGIIVNIQNNTQTQFKINQTSLDGQSTVQIGQINPGLNEANLHTAALQTPTTTTQSSQQPATTTNCFEIVENATQPSINISLKIFSGTQLVIFLQSLPNNKKDDIDMNGLPTSVKYLATPQDWYLVLIQNPSTPGASQPNPDQRIQAINLSKLSGPYLLSMQINQESIEITSATGKVPASMMDIFQPSLTTVLEVKNATIATQNYPLVILPQFLWTNATLQAYWILLNSSYIAARSNNKFFDPNSFGNAFEYFTGLGCFDMKNKYAFCIDRYNLLKPGNTFHDATWIMGSALYETNLKNCSDVPQLHSSQDADGNIIGNGSAFIYLNFQVQLHPPSTLQPNSINLFTTHSFFAVYTQPSYQLWTMLCSILMTEMKDGAFAEFTKMKNGVFKLLWTNKKNQILHQQFLYFNETVSKIDLSFINQGKNWTGATIPQNLLNLNVSIKNDFKVTYESMPTVNKHLLSVQATSPIDKSRIIHTSYILPRPKTNQPITSLYYDLYEVFQSSSFTRCQIIQNDNLPSFLANLTVNDWENGIYVIPSVANHAYLTLQNPGYLTVTFYKSDKTLLGHIQSKGLYQNNANKPGIQAPVRYYSMHSTSFNSLFDFDLSSGVLLKYSNN